MQEIEALITIYLLSVGSRMRRPLIAVLALAQAGVLRRPNWARDTTSPKREWTWSSTSSRSSLPSSSGS
jgi:hypothetical protein